MASFLIIYPLAIITIPLLTVYNFYIKILFLFRTIYINLHFYNLLQHHQLLLYIFLTKQTNSICLLISINNHIQIILLKTIHCQSHKHT